MTYASHAPTDASRFATSFRRAVALIALVVLAAGFSGCDKLKARDLLNKGVAAFKNGQYDQAGEFFKQAKDLDPSLLNARLYLATSYASQYIPGAPSEQNRNVGKQAIAEFKDILGTNPENLSAVDGVGSILFQMAGTPYEPYWIGVIDWTLAFRANAEMRKAYNEKNVAKQAKQVKDTEPLPAAIRADYIAQFGPMIDEGIADLQRAITIRPDYDDAMAYLNLLYRRKADTVESATERASLLKQADDLVDKVKEVKQKRASQPPPAA